MASPSATAPAGGHQALPGQKSGMHLETLAEGFQIQPQPGQRGNQQPPSGSCLLGPCRGIRAELWKVGREGVAPLAARAPGRETAGPTAQPWPCTYLLGELGLLMSPLSWSSYLLNEDNSRSYLQMLLPGSSGRMGIAGCWVKGNFRWFFHLKKMWQNEHNLN